MPIRICSMDIEASSSHGDFPVAIKSYKKLAGELQTHWTDRKTEVERMNRRDQLQLLRNQILSCFKFAEVPCDGISEVFTKDEVDR